jgi:hypothetical protein
VSEIIYALILWMGMWRRGGCDGGVIVILGSCTGRTGG